MLILKVLYRGVEQLVACRAHNPEVAGSSPASATKVPVNDAGTSKLVESRLAFLFLK